MNNDGEIDQLEIIRDMAKSLAEGNLERNLEGQDLDALYEQLTVCEIAIKKRYLKRDDKAYEAYQVLNEILQLKAAISGELAKTQNTQDVGNPKAVTLGRIADKLGVDISHLLQSKPRSTQQQ